MFLILPKRDLRRNTIACRRSFVREKERFSFKLPNSFAQIKIFFLGIHFFFVSIGVWLKVVCILVVIMVLY